MCQEPFRQSNPTLAPSEESKRDRWFAELLELGFEEPLFDESIPEKYKTDQWWREIAG